MLGSEYVTRTSKGEIKLRYNYLIVSKQKLLFKIIKNNDCLFEKKLYLCTVVVWT